MLDTAIVLSAGQGTRLRPLTDSVPKVLVPVGDRPLLFHTLDRLAASGIRRVGINLHHLGDRIREAVGDGAAWGIEVCYSDEAELLGSAGAVRALAGFIGERRFAVLYGDVLTDLDVRVVEAAHEAAGAVLTMALTTADDPTRCGVVETDVDRRVTRFVEKPMDAKRDATVNAVIYVCEPSVLASIPAGRSDFGADVIPAMLREGRPIAGVPVDAYVQDVGTPEGYRSAVRSFAEGRIECRSS